VASIWLNRGNPPVLNLLQLKVPCRLLILTSCPRDVTQLWVGRHFKAWWASFRVAALFSGELGSAAIDRDGPIVGPRQIT